MTVKNTWAEPEGYKDKPRPIRYWIRNPHWINSPRVEHQTVPTLDSITGTYYHCLAGSDQDFAEETARLLQKACEYFYLPDTKYVEMLGVHGHGIVVTDDEIRDRIRRIELGENKRESDRVKQYQGSSKGYYVFSDLPWHLQRALVEQLELLKIVWQYELVGEVPEGDRRTEPSYYESENAWQGD
jgi:hypothetical protein